MEAGRELDVLIAENVMGWSKIKMSMGDWGEVEIIGDPRLREAEHFMMSANINPYPHYSTDIAAAWEVAQKIKDMDENNQFVIHLSDSKFEECQVEIKYWIEDTPGDWVLGGPFYILGKTAPHAICLAALRAVGYEFST